MLRKGFLPGCSASMQAVLSILAIVFLFVLIGRLAGVVVSRARALGTRLGIGTFFLGVLLGLFTSAPEATIAINAAAAQAPSLSSGNLIGGTAVLFGLIAALLAIRAKSLPVHEGISGIAAAAVYLLAPVLLALDGSLSPFDGLVLGAGYFGVLILVYGASRRQGFALPHTHLGNGSSRDILILIAAVAAIALCAGAVVRLTVPIAVAFGIPELVIGIIAYSLGTNLPELAIAARASNRPDSLPVATLLGSSLANPFMLGLLALGVEKPLTFDGGFMPVAVAYCAIVILFFVFARSGRRFVRAEGVLLLATYVIFALLAANTL